MREFIPGKIKDSLTGKERECHLVKYEKHQYNTIRIGTLEYYRNIEGNQSDDMEGRVEGVTYKAEQDQYVTRDDVLSLTNGSLDIIARDGIKFGKGGSYTDEKPRRCHNTYIYCCSIEFGVFPNPERMAHFQAKETTVIDNPNEFKHAISEELFLKATQKNGAAFSKELHYIKCWEAPVRYMQRKNADITLPLNNLDFFIYQKDPKYSIEQEYRFTWMFFEKKTNKPVEASLDPVDVDCNHEIGTAFVKFN